VKLQDCLGLSSREMICVVGAGGKTTLLFTLGKELFKCGKKVLLTTTTKIYVPDQQDIYTVVEPEDNIMKNPGILIGKEKTTVWGRDIYQMPGDKDKIVGVKKEVLDWLFIQNIIDYILIEADGAKKKPIKAPDEHEPCIPEKTTTVLGVIGIDAVGRTLNEDNFHRAGIFLKAKHYDLNYKIDVDMVASLIGWEKGLFKDVPSNARKLLILNKVDNSERRNIAQEIARKVLMNESAVAPEKIIFSSFKEGKIKLEVFE